MWLGYRQREFTYRHMSKPLEPLSCITARNIDSLAMNVGCQVPVLYPSNSNLIFLLIVIIKAALLVHLISPRNVCSTRKIEFQQQQQKQPGSLSEIAIFPHAPKGSVSTRTADHRTRSCGHRPFQALFAASSTGTRPLPYHPVLLSCQRKFLTLMKLLKMLSESRNLLIPPLEFRAL